MSKQKAVDNYTDSLNRQQNFLFNHISGELRNVADNQESAINKFMAIQAGNITTESFELLGALCYLTGLDFSNQVILTEKVCENVRDRFENFEFSREFKAQFISALNFIKVDLDGCFSQIDDAKNTYKTVFTSPVNLNSFQAAQIKGNIKHLVNNSILPVNLVETTFGLVTKKDLTYDDILKINNIINLNLKFVGKKSIKSMGQLYGNQVFIDLINESVKAFDAQKFGVVYFDAILSIIESRQFRQLNNVLLHFDELVFTTIEDEEKTDILPEVKSELTELNEMSQTDIQKLAEENPVQHVFNVFDDILNRKIKNHTDTIEAIQLLYNDIDYGKNVFHYIKARLKDVETLEIVSDDNKALVEELQTYVEILKHDVKQTTEQICAEIPVNNINRVKSMVVDVINSLILDDTDKKQYLISQVFDCNITTYQHLMQLLTLIENCDIIGENMATYYLLKKYLTDTTEVKDKFELGRTVEEQHNKVLFFMGFLKFFEKLYVKTEGTNAK